MNPRIRTSLFAAAGLAAFFVGFPVSAFLLSRDSQLGVTTRWPASRTIVLESDLGASGALLDGNTSWNSVAASAATAWSGLADVNLTLGTGTRPHAELDGVNSLFFDATAYGTPFGDAVAITSNFYFEDGVVFESDVTFDSNRPWNSFRGAARAGVVDLRRIAVHELGHVMGLGHPDAAGQSVTAIMNSAVGNLENPQADDINGLRALYGGFTATPDRMVAGSTMIGGSWLTSQNGRYRLYMQADSNLVLYDMSSNTALWFTGASAANGLAIFQSDGNFVVYDGTMSPIWTTATQGNPGAFLVLENDGNLVLYSATGQPLWARGQ